MGEEKIFPLPKTKEEASWRMFIKYRAHHGSLIRRFYLDEIEEAHDIVESGPHFDTIIKIEIERINHCSSPCLTLDEAAEL